MATRKLRFAQSRRASFLPFAPLACAVLGLAACGGTRSSANEPVGPVEPTPAAWSVADREAELCAAETAFALAFARRDEAAFTEWIDEGAVFSGAAEPLRGRAAVMEVWREFLASAEPPFSWQPRSCLVGPDGDLGSTTGPVLDPSGKQVGAFSSVWRRGAGGEWRVLFDSSPPCPRCGS